MKKLFAVLLALMMLSSAVAFAEEGAVNEPGAAEAIDEIVNFTLTTDAIPEGYEFEQTMIDGVIYYSLTPSDDLTLPMYLGSIAYSEEFVGYTLDVAALNDEQKAEMEARMGVDMYNPVFSYAKTTHGTDLLIINENDVASDIVEVVTIYDGYVVTISIFTISGEIAQESIDRAVQFLSDMWIVKAE